MKKFILNCKIASNNKWVNSVFTFPTFKDCDTYIQLLLNKNAIKEIEISISEPFLLTKTLSYTDVLYTSQWLSNYTYNNKIKETAELINLIDEHFLKTPSTNYKDYVEFYDKYLYTYRNWNDLIQSEQEQTDGLSPSECINQLNNTIFKLPCGWYVQLV